MVIECVFTNVMKTKCIVLKGVVLSFCKKHIVALILFCCFIVLFLLLRINISQGIRQEEIHGTKRVSRTLKIATCKTTKDVDFASTSKHLGRVWITFTSFTCQMISLSLGRRQSSFRFVFMSFVEATVPHLLKQILRALLREDNAMLAQTEPL